MTDPVDAHLADRFEIVTAAEGNFEIRRCPQRRTVWISLFGDRTNDKGEAALAALQQAYSDGPRQLVLDYRAADYPDDLFAVIKAYGRMGEMLPPSRIAALRLSDHDPVVPLLALELEAAGHEVSRVTSPAELDVWLAAH